ncbi:hypothetical protein N7520_010531 [Penicillium odoratum]|uniref:uncharacterized protein n=1 Tax=Penicillium odoratum TaxID=1167516 RepID=UPI0025477857|nr:uncharacterized protein N7520_010531 [Penicillium odoratum]KAJ5745349.1 hypothetical protein N7520_010531 [Penicillium odoratum]
MESDPNALYLTSNLPDRCIRFPDEKRLWCHFVDVTCHMLTLPFDASHDPIMSGIISKGLHDTLVLNAILCLGASHLINPMRPEAPEVQALTKSKQCLLRKAQEELSTRASALQSNKLTAHNNAEFEILLTAYLLLYLYELSEGAGDDSWETRLDDTRTFVYGVLGRHRTSESGSRSLSDDEIQTPFNEDFEFLGIDKFLMQFFSYHDILGNVTSGNKFLSQRYSPASLLAWETDYFEYEHMLGMHHGLVEIISHVHTLQLDTSNAAFPRHIVITRAVDIWQDVNEWAIPESDLDLRHIYDAYIAAISIWILSIIYPGDVAKDKVQTMVSRGIASLTSMEGYSFQIVSLLPFFVIGLGCIRQQDREALEAQLRRCEMTRCLGYIRLCRTKIRKVWQDYDGGINRSWNWECISQDGSLPLV